MEDWTERHERVLADADPLRGLGPGDLDVYDRTWSRVSQSVAFQRPRRFSRTVVASIAAALLLGVGGTAAAAVLVVRNDPGSSHTGEYAQDREDRVLGGPGEKLDTRGDDFRAAVADATLDIPFPTHTARRLSLAIEMQGYAQAPGSQKVVVSTSAMAGFVANDAICAWSNQWAHATRTGDAPELAEATDELDAASSWPAVSTLQRLDADRFDWLAGVEQAAHGSSISAMGAALATNVLCGLELIPALPQAMPPGITPCQISLHRTACHQHRPDATHVRR